MPKRSSKQPDVAQIAHRLLGELTDPKPKAKPVPDDLKAAAAALGRRGGLKGGPARAKALSAKRRKKIAEDAAKKRWG